MRQTFATPPAGVRLTWVEQNPQLGTGHAVMVCRKELARLSGPVLVVAGDGPLVRGSTLKRLLAEHVRRGAACTLATSILDDPGRYGRIVRDERGELVGIAEYLDADESQRQIKEVNVSLYCFDAVALVGVLDRLTNDNVKGEYYLTDALGLLRADGKALAAVAAVPSEEVLSINTMDQLHQVEGILAARREGECDARSAQAVHRSVQRRPGPQDQRLPGPAPGGGQDHPVPRRRAAGQAGGGRPRAATCSSSSRPASR